MTISKFSTHDTLINIVMPSGVVRWAIIYIYLNNSDRYCKNDNAKSTKNSVNKYEILSFSILTQTYFPFSLTTF